MKDVEKLLRKAKALLDQVADALFPDNADGFLECLGVEPKKYERRQPDGSIGYDFLKVLADTAVEDWEDCEGIEKFMNEMQSCEIVDDVEEDAFIKNPWSYPGWNSLTRAEKQKILKTLDIPEENMEQYIKYTGVQQKPAKDLFGWG